MKRFISTLIAVMVCVQAFSVAAFASDEIFYPDAEGKYTIGHTFDTDKTDSEYGLVVIEASEAPAKFSLGDGSMIRHIDQAEASGTEVSFDMFKPKNLQDGGQYFVYIGGDGLDFATKIGTLSLEKLIVAEIEWPEVKADEITFDQTLAEAFAGKLPTDPIPTARIDEVDYAGRFEVVDATKKPNAGTYEAKLKFVITAAGDYENKEFTSEKVYPVTVNKAAFVGEIKAEDQTAEFTGEAVKYDVNNVTISGDAEIDKITYNTADAEAPVDAGEYTVTISFKSTDDNYLAPADKTATLTISKATVEEVADVTETFTAEEVKDVSGVAGLVAKLPEKINIPYGKGYSEDIAVEWTPVDDEWNVKGGVDYEFTPDLGEGKNLNVSENFKGIISVTVVTGTLDTTDFVDKTVPQKTVSDANSLEDLDIPAKANLTIGNKEPEYIDLKWNKTLTDVKAAAETVTETTPAEVVFELLPDTFAEYPWLTISVDKSIKMTIKLEEVILEWPDPAVVVKPITFGDKLADAFDLSKASKEITIDGVVHTGEFVLVNDPEYVPAAGTVEAKLAFKISGEAPDGCVGCEHINDEYNTDSPGYYIVTVNQAAFTGTIVADDVVADYCGEAIEYDQTKIAIDGKTLEECKVEVAEILYDGKAEAPETAGTYTVTISFTSTDSNIADPVGVTETTLTINKVEAEIADKDALVLEFTADELADYSELESDAAFAAFISDRLNTEFDVVYGEDGTGEIDNIEWALDGDAVWSVKGPAEYKFTPSFESANFDVADFEYVVKVAAVNGTVVFEDSNETLYVKKAEVLDENVIDFIDLGVPYRASLELDGYAAPIEINELLWDKGINELKELAEEVNEETNPEVELAITLTDATFAEYKWATIAPVTVKIVVTHKETVVVDDITVSDAVYGDAVEIIPPVLDLDDENVELKIYYSGILADGTPYEESEEAPTEAGSYQAVARVISDIYTGYSKAAEFSITPLPVTFTVEDASRPFGTENPEFAGALDIDVLPYEDTLEDLGIEITCEAKIDSPVVDPYVITATKGTNKNYDVEVVDGVLTIDKADFPTTAPVITGEAIVGATLETAIPDGIYGDTTGIEIFWYVDDVDVATGSSYEVKLEDSGKTITAAVVATEEAVNYNEGETDKSNEKTIDKYEVTGGLEITTVPDELAEGTQITVDITGVEDKEIFGFTYQWFLNGEAIEGATDATLEISAEMTEGEISVTVTPAENFDGSLSKVVGAIGKTVLKGSLELVADEVAVGTVIEAVVDVAAEADYDLVWFVNGEEADIEGTTYELTKDDYGKVFSAKLVAKGSYTGVIESNEVPFETIAPSNVNITTETAGTSIKVTLTADANGQELYFVVSIKEKDAEEVLDTVEVEADEDGNYTYTFDGLTAGLTYTIEAIAYNEDYESEAKAIDVAAYYAGVAGPSNNKKPVNNNNKNEETTPTTPGETPDTSVSVESKTETATVPSKDLAGKDTAYATVTTDGGNKVEVAVDIKDKAVDSLTVKAETSEKEVTGKAAEGVIGEVIEVKVEAKSGDEAVEVGATITVKADAPAYAYAVDELGNTVRLDSTYDAENGEVVVANVPDGTVLAVSTNAPVDFADVEGRWSEAEVQKAADLGIVNGRGEGYAPEALLTRSETNKLKKNLAEVLKLVLPVNEEVEIDTDPAHWAYESDLWAAQTGITTGTGVNEDGEVIISGEDNVIRQDYITLIARMIKLAIGDAEVEGEAIVFADAADIADYAADAFNLLSSVGILKGSEGENGIVANPKASITREEAAALSNRAYDFVKAVKIEK